MNNIIVFGANGFIGKNLISELSKHDNNNIIAFDRFSKSKEEDEYYFKNFNNVTIFRGDFLDKDDVDKALAGIDYVFHSLSMTNPASVSNDPFTDIDTNVRASIVLFDMCVKNNIEKIVYLSSGGTVYGDIDSIKISEESATKPKSPYGIGKLTIENYLRYFKESKGLDYIIYRIANPYGPKQNITSKQGVIPIFINHILKNEELVVYGDGSMQRDYIYIDDVCRMINYSYRSNNRYAEYNIGSGVGTSVSEILKQIEKITDIIPKVTYAETPASFVNASVLDGSRFSNEFGEFKLTELSVGLKRTLDYVKSKS